MRPNAPTMVLAPLDGSPDAETSLPWAVLLAKATGSKLKLVSIHAPPAMFLDGQTVVGSVIPDDEVRDVELEYLAKTAKKAQEAGADVSTDLVEGGVVAALAEYANKNHPDWIVMASHARGPVARFFLGETASEFIRESPCPVLLVHPPKDGIGSAALPTVKHVLLPLDGSELAEAMIEPAKRFATAFGVDVHLIKAGTPDKGAYLEPVARRLNADYRVVEGNPRDVIVSAAEQRPGTVIAMATHGRGGLAKLVWGNVADAVVHRTELPILVMRPPGC